MAKLRTPTDDPTQDQAPFDQGAGGFDFSQPGDTSQFGFGDPTPAPPQQAPAEPTYSPRIHTMNEQDNSGFPDQSGTTGPQTPEHQNPSTDIGVPPVPTGPIAPPTVDRTPPPAAGSGLDPNSVVANWMATNNPQGHQDAAYWVRRINETGGLRADNLAYWQGRFLEAPGTHQEGSTYQPTSKAPSIFPGPTQQVGTDPLSLEMSAKLRELIANNGQVKSPLGDQLSASLAGILSNNGKPDPADLAMRQEMARQPVDAAHKAQLSTMNAQLADRGLLGAPGAPSGAEGGSMVALESNLAPAYASAAQGASVAAGEQANQKLISAMSTAAGISATQAATLLGSISAGTDRQQMLANIAAKSLDQNIAWNEFLANYGLNRDQVMYMIQNNQLGALAPLLKAFIDQSGNANQGYV